jgi:phosphoglycerol transferase MdoB-like AlkP superfamily enzyme
MKKALIKFITVFCLFTALFALLKPAFMAIYAKEIGSTSIIDWLSVIGHGLSMDMCVAGYLTILPGLLICTSLLTSSSITRRILDIYMAIVAAMIAIVYTLDFGLYGSWGFRLDMTPLFYIATSPTSAMASLQWWHWLLGIVGLILISGSFWLAYYFTARKIEIQVAETIKHRIGQSLAIFVLTAGLFVPIRGSLTVSTMNISKVYYSPNQRLNHSAINPIFNLLYSATHQSNFDEEYRFMDDDVAKGIVDELLGRNLPAETDSAAIAMLSNQRPDIILIILESFSAHLLPSLGGDSIAVGLDSIARDGILFTNFYASSFRTDRGLAAILSSFPGPTSTSLLKYTEKFERLPSLASQLKSAGYDAAYYYGGDDDFTNMHAYLVSSGFDPIISDKDFAIGQITSKWGAHDDVLFSKALTQLSNKDHNRPHFTVIQTSSSHEPFEVPYANPRFAGKPRRNAFAFTDSCLTDFVNSISRKPQWKNTLMVIVPDHYGCWPENISNPLQRHHIPLVMTGGAISRRGFTIDKLASQTDIGATIMAMLGLRWNGIRYSRNIFSRRTPPVAIFTEPTLIGIITPTDTVAYNPDAEFPVIPSPTLEPVAKAFMRDLYSNLNSL